MSEIVDRQNLDFVLYQVLDLDRLLGSERYGEHDRESIVAMLDLTQALAEEHFLPFAGKLDAAEPSFVDGKVEIIPEVADALRVYADAGLFNASFDESSGGLQLPWVVTNAINGMFSAANLSVANYTFLTVAAANMLSAFGSQEQRAKFLPSMQAGQWTGTMCLSEPQAGSSLGDIRTVARKSGTAADGTPQWSLAGTKTWISGGDHDLTENIVHMVLARTEGGLTGVKGISLFVVPRYRVEADGGIGAWNNISLAGLNHKMGQRGTVNCVLNFGEAGETLGTMVGEEGQGLAYMFSMMNEARVGVGHASVMLGLAGYLHALAYARERPQGRKSGGDPESGQVPIIEHSDVRRMLLAQKATVEGGLALTMLCAFLVDERKISRDDAERADLDLLLGVLTPIAKSWPSEHCLEANKHAIQILGGYGYTRDYPVERFYRDNRLNHIHEGTFGIQGRDLLGRKVKLQDGRGVDLLRARIHETIDEARSKAEFDGEVAALQDALAALERATRASLGANDRDLALSNATLYLDAFGTVVVAWLWLRQGLAALHMIEPNDTAFCDGKLAAMRFFFRYELPRSLHQFSLVETLDDTFENINTRAFGG